ncbi:hypothetical protein PPTG_19651 [Phytophthora nicotianae INRA-310]|uniref:Uncharacterized protein n=1 Tax=Phytophthora nicotianae (strain INRA-310) TaxID=761204 RepID=W2PBP2_PHYN3|nr:hypothetical protein PPTG_19651 [Phytophthora nicotianae INRA-310]ETM98251.1 hypothetical protein PPTG_19651 [Phytophthora nicotianae INRA-310]
MNWGPLFFTFKSDSKPELEVLPGSTWVCPPIDVEWYEDWDAFRTYMDGYQPSTRQVFRQRTSVSARSLRYATCTTW